MVKIGMMIGDRYEILEKIGTGGMSDVYKAKCHKLNRNVAVKVLKQEFAENANFVSKFKVEAQAAAGLMHPNIVNVYDVGEENGINYIVMELVEGITLKKYIEKKARLSVKEAVTIAIQIGLGIEAAHNNHIIHRDIKPQNVIISKEGKVKVTDFGIAKAATSNTITSNVMGSVHYTSPEQARGGFSDEKSDIYSLGITLFEMLTGRVPFNGETTVAIAIKQIQEAMPSPRDYVDDIPVSVEQIVLKCTQKSPDRRYQSMGALIEDLKKTFITPDENFVTIVTEDEFGETRTVNHSELENIKSIKENFKGEDDTMGTTPKVNTAGKGGETDYDSKMDRITTILAIVVGVIILFIVILLIGKGIGAIKLGKDDNKVPVSEVSIEKPEQVVMPKVIHIDRDKAEALLIKANLNARIIYEESEDYAEGIVVRSSVNEGLKVNVGSEVVLYVSSGKSSVIVPDVVGYTLSAANKSIMDRGLTPEQKQEYSDVIPAGNIISQSPAGDEKAPVGSKVVIVVSLGKTETLVPMPNVLGKQNDDAVLTLNEFGFSVKNTTEVYSDVYAEGYVCYQSLDAGKEYPKGTEIDLQVSKGQEPQKAVLYRYNASVNAPSTAEAPEFQSGTEVKVVITGLDGKELYNSTTTSFPLPVNIWNISGCNSGILTLTFDITTEPETEVDEDGNETIVVPGKTETQVIRRDINFEIQD